MPASLDTAWDRGQQWARPLDIGSWLRGLGLGQYEETFRENEIDESILSSLTAEDLKELGVGPLGHRRKLLDAISALRAGDAPSPVSASTSSTPVAVYTTAPEAAGERRHVTVMFCDLVDSTGIAAKLGAEEWRDPVGAYLEAASAAVTNMGGKVAKKLGDGLMEARARRELPSELSSLVHTANTQSPRPAAVLVTTQLPPNQAVGTKTGSFLRAIGLT
jgi:class 3 adenylate cyclase